MACRGGGRKPQRGWASRLASASGSMARSCTISPAAPIRDRQADPINATVVNNDQTASLGAGHTQLLAAGEVREDRLRLLAYGYRDGMPRHRTLRALLDWSYDILGEDERRALRRLSVFRGVFTLESARALLAALGGADERVASLVRRSLLSVQVGEARVRYRLLDSTRDYAFEKLVDSGDAPDALAAFLADCRTTYELSVSGLMCIPPVDDEAALHFALLANIARRNQLPCLSMGMSGDSAVAIAAGSTMVRVGSAIFGER